METKSSNSGSDTPSNFAPCLNGLRNSEGQSNEAVAIRVSSVTGSAAAVLDSDPNKARGLVLKGVCWTKEKITVSMMDPIEIPELVDAIKKIANRWTENTNIKFEFLAAPNTPADIRIKFTEKGSYWSMIGTNSSAASTSGASMNLGFDRATFSNPKELERLILHEFGHALGLAHEHQNQELHFDINAAVAYFQRNGLGHLSPADIARQFTQYKKEEIDDRSSHYDLDSIMLYSFPPNIATPTKYNYSLSATDVATIHTLYPAVEPLNPARVGMEIEVDSKQRVAYYLFGKDEAQFYFLARKAGKYEIHVTSETDSNVVDPYANIPVFLKSPVSDEDSGSTVAEKSVIEIGLFNSILLLGTSFLVYPEVDSGDGPSPASQPLEDSEFVVEMNRKAAPASSKVIEITKTGWYYIKTRISEPKGEEPCRFVLSVSSK